jgi:predicted transcriptional regulator
MNCLITIVLLLLPFNVLFAQINTDSATSIEDYRWKNRVLIIKSSATTEEIYQKQNLLLTENENSVNERDLIILSVFAHKSPRLNGENVELESENAILERYKLTDTDFAVILIGKDGGEKYRSDSIVMPDEIFKVIDRMPMRRREMRKQ